MKYSVILAAAGRSSRFNDKHYKKPFIRLNQKAVWLHSAEKFLDRQDVCQVILVIAKEDRAEFQTLFGSNIAIMGVQVVEGGNERADSVQNALAKVDADADFVAIHDAARPCISSDDIDRVFAAAAKVGSAILATPVTSTLKSIKDGAITETIPRTDKWLAQTPQVFRKTDIVDAYNNRGSAQPTDEAELMEQSGVAVAVVEGSPLNIKLTTKADLQLAGAILKSKPGKPESKGGQLDVGDLFG